MKFKHIAIFVSSAFLSTHIAFAEPVCMADIEVVIAELKSQHYSLSETDHLAVENSIGDLMYLCKEGSTDSFNEKLSEVKAILGI
ncbi:hypothetical protein [Vibrio sp. EJY3]|uniref:hypothetical protein n=1 Tax=Vibrio sp. (strain EJY3) TaxID=1116375 RepID=UPI000243BA45|nr:hypothetical protein [Vibrio sp. EJY3]AEX22116.1 hypothetical protein VEJY3_08140 [Vibrio sp. EJY3]